MNRRTTRRGFSVVQALGAMFITGLLTMTGARVLQVAYRAQRSTLDQLRQLEALAQISDRMKADAAQATQCTVIQPTVTQRAVTQRAVINRSAGKQLELLCDDQTVRYALDGDSMVRRWGPLLEPSPGAQSESEALPGEQRWPVPSGTTVSWQLDPAEQHSLLRCTLSTGDQRSDIQWAYLIQGASNDQ